MDNFNIVCVWNYLVNDVSQSCLCISLSNIPKISLLRFYNDLNLRETLMEFIILKYKRTNSHIYKQNKLFECYEKYHNISMNFYDSRK